VFTRPDDLPDAVLIEAISTRWALEVVSLGYRAVGFGSHHWDAADRRGRRWFVTVDDLESRLWSPGESVEIAFGRLEAALATARAAGDAGARFVVGPVVDGDGAVVARVTGRYALALYPSIDGRTHRWGDDLSASDRLAVAELMATLHGSSADVTRSATTDGFVLPQRDALARALGELGRPWDEGAFSESARALLSPHGGAVERMLADYDRRADEARARAEPMVLTHGEPHPGNLILTATGWVLVDWDTAMMAPPERDLWMVDAGDGRAIAAYEEATGRAVVPSVLDLYRLRWDLADLCLYVALFRAPHAATADAEESWRNLNACLDHLGSMSSGL